MNDEHYLRHAQFLSSDEFTGLDPVSKVHDWRNHLPESVKADWEIFGIASKCAIMDACEQAADREEWG